MDSTPHKGSILPSSGCGDMDLVIIICSHREQRRNRPKRQDNRELALVFSPSLHLPSLFRPILSDLALIVVVLLRRVRVVLSDQVVQVGLGFGEFAVWADVSVSQDREDIA